MKHLHHSELHLLTGMQILCKDRVHARPVHSVAAADLLVFSDALRVHEAMCGLGFDLQPSARCYRSGAAHWTVRLVWRRRVDAQSNVLSLRLRVVGH